VKVDEGYKRIGTRVAQMGEAVGNGLIETAAKEFGLKPHTPVSVSIIDAHAGGIGNNNPLLSVDCATQFQFQSSHQIQKLVLCMSVVRFVKMVCKLIDFFCLFFWRDTWSISTKKRQRFD
jgi:hypothetical protein